MAKTDLFCQCITEDIAHKYDLGHSLKWRQAEIDTFIVVMDNGLKKELKSDKKKAKRCGVYPDLEKWHFNIDTITFKRYF